MHCKVQSRKLSRDEGSRQAPHRTVGSSREEARHGSRSLLTPECSIPDRTLAVAHKG